MDCSSFRQTESVTRVRVNGWRDLEGSDSEIKRDLTCLVHWLFLRSLLYLKDLFPWIILVLRTFILSWALHVWTKHTLRTDTMLLVQFIVIDRYHIPTCHLLILWQKLLFSQHEETHLLIPMRAIHIITFGRCNPYSLWCEIMHGRMWGD